MRIRAQLDVGKRVFVLALLVLGAMAVTVLPGASASTAAGASTTSTTVAPAPGAKKNVVTFGTQTASATKPDGRGYYSFSATPGAQVLDHVAVINYSNKTITVSIRAADAVNTPQGGFAVLPVNEPSKDIGTWIELRTSDLTLTVPPRTDEIIPFLVLVPKNATPGDHVGAITATLQSLIVSGSGQKVRLLQTVGTRVFLRVNGPLHPGFAVENLKVSYHGTLDPVGTGSVRVSYTLHNRGNVALGGRQTVYVSGLFGSKTVAVHVAQVPLLLPGSSLGETVSIHGVFPELREHAHVSISPLYIQGSVQPVSGPYTATVTVWAIPWTLLAIVLAIILLIFGLLRRRRRRSKARQKKPQDRPSGPIRDGKDSPDRLDGSHEVTQPAPAEATKTGTEPAPAVLTPDHPSEGMPS